MPTLDRDELARFLDEHLTAQTVMVPIAEPLDPTLLIGKALEFLEENDFDLALVDSERLLVLFREAARHAAAATPSRHAGEVAESPRRDRVIERTLPLRQVTRKLRDDPYHPLLVIGDDAITHIIAVADFAGAAGTAAVAMGLLTLDVKLNSLLLTERYRDAAWQALDDQQRKQAEKWQEKAGDQQLPDPLNYLSMSWRLQIVRALELPIGTDDQHTMLINTRNAAFHGLHDPHTALAALDLAEQLLEQVDQQLQRRLDRF